MRTPSSLTRRAALALPLLAAPTVARAALTVTDVTGRTVTLRGPAERAVVGFYCDEVAAIIGAAGWDRVAGFSRRQWAVNRAETWRRYRTAVPRLADLPDVGAWEDQSFSAERVLALRPDLLIVPPWAASAHAAQMAPIEAARIPVLVVDYNAQSVERHVASTLAIGRALGAERRASELAELYRTRTAETLARARSAGRSPRVYVEIGMSGPERVGNSYKNTMWGRMLDHLGADNIANPAMPLASGFQPIAPEHVLAARPEHIVVTGSSWESQPRAVRLGYGVTAAEARASLTPYLDRPGWASLPAVIERNVHTVEHSMTRSLTDWIALQFLGKQLFPEAFADVDPITALRAFHEAYLPVPFSGTWMLSLKP
jgi:iron complex transport system substrate-binding protein